MIDNPVLRKELLLRARFRQPTPARIGMALGAAALVGFVYYEAFTSLSVDPTANAAHAVWRVVMGLQFLLVCLLAPAISANAIAQEKEQQTWEMLVSTRLRPDEIVVGKLLSRVILIGALMVLFLPVSLYCAFANADLIIPVTTVLCAEATTFITGLFFTTFAMFMSWLLNRTLYALILSYTFVVGGLVISTALITAMLQFIVSDNDFLYTCPLMWFNPVMMFFESMSQTNYAQSPLYLAFGLTGYLLLSILMVWRMIAGFRPLSND